MWGKHIIQKALGASTTPSKVPTLYLKSSLGRDYPTFSGCKSNYEQRPPTFQEYGISHDL